MRRNSSGFLTIEIIGAIFIATLLTLGLMQWQDSALEDMRGQQAAQHHKQVVDAALKYIKDNHATITATATAAVPVRVTVAMLQAAPGRYLDAAFSPNNSFGQTACVLVLQPVANKISALVVTENGKAIADKDIHYVASLTGKGAGAVSSTAPTLSQGAYGSFSVPLAPFNSQNCSGTAVNAGHLANYLYFDGEGDLLADYLYRDAVPGHPEANTMNTPLIMAATKILGDTCPTLGAIARDAAGKVLSCNGSNWKSQGSAYWEDPVNSFASLPACNAATTWQTRIVKTPTTGSGARAYTCNSAGTWQALAINDNGDMTIPNNLTVAQNASLNTLSGRLQLDNTTVVVEGAACPNGSADNGRIARDANGLLLSCQSGVWGKQTAKVPTTQILSFAEAAFVPTTRYCPAGYAAIGSIAISAPSGQSVCLATVFNLVSGTGSQYSGSCAYALAGDSQFSHYLTCMKL